MPKKDEPSLGPRATPSPADTAAGVVKKPANPVENPDKFKNYVDENRNKIIKQIDD